MLSLGGLKEEEEEEEEEEDMNTSTHKTTGIPQDYILE
jgi:hypothetical protein